MNERVAIYCRLSEEDREKSGADSQSIQNQRVLLRAYAQQQGWCVVDEWVDDDWAGTDRARPGFRSLIAGAEQGRYDIVLCKTQSRFTREMELVEHYLHDCFPRWGVRFVSVVDRADTADRTNKKARQINGLINEWYLEDLSENIRAVLTSRRKNGLHIGSSALYGYRKDPAQKGHLIPDPLTAPVVQEIYRRYAGGESQKAIAQALNARGEPSPAVRKGRPKGEWRAASIATMLRNEMYCGTLVQGRYGSASYKTRKNVPRPSSLWYRVPDTHQALVEPELWHAVQQRLRHRAQPIRHDGGLFSGQVFCQLCGAPLCVTTTAGRRYLQCRTHHTDRSACPGAFISESALQSAVFDCLTELIASNRAQLEPLCHRSADDAAAVSCRQALARCETTLARVYLDGTAGSLSDEMAQSLISRIERDAAQLRSQLQALEQPPAPVRYQPEVLTASAVRCLIARVSVGRRMRGSRTVPVTVYWRF